MNGKAETGSRCRRLILCLGLAMAMPAPPAAADLWYEHYANAETAIAEQDWKRAVEESNQAIARKGDSGARVRSYGMNVVAYFPYFKLGVAYYHLEQFDAALQAFETELRLGAITQSESASAELESYRGLAREASVAAAAEEQQRIRQIVEQGLAQARDLESRGLLEEAIVAADSALAVAPDDALALDVMSRLRGLLAEREREQDLDRRVSGLVEDGRELLGKGQYDEASSLFRQALFLKQDRDIQALLDDAQRRLLAQLEAGRGFDSQQAAVSAGMEDAVALEVAGRFTAALDRLESVLALDPSNREALAIQARVLQLHREAEIETARQATINALLGEAGDRFDAGAVEEALSAANRALAFDPGNARALEIVARAYAVISRDLLGTGPRVNLPPAVRFVDLRETGDDGMLRQAVGKPDFRLDGVIIDDSRVEVEFFDADGTALESSLSSQPLGEFFLTEFHVASKLLPGPSTFRLVATDSQGLASASEYAVVYIRPFHRAPGFYALVIGGGVIVFGLILWRRYRHRAQLRKRRFNPYIAGAPVLEEDLFFGRRELIDRILQTIHNNSLLIYGERRIGKTSIQHQLKRRLRELDDPLYAFYPVFVDLQGTPESHFFQVIAEDIFQELSPELDGLEPAKDFSSDYSYRDFVRDLQAVLKALKKRTAKKVKLVLLIDEVDEMNDYDPRVNQKLRSLFMKSFAENLVAVVSGVEIKKEWEREGSPWYNFFEEIEVRPFDPRDARELIERPISGIFKLEGGVVEKIISLTAGKPYLIQKLCVSLVTHLHDQQRRRITIEDVEAVARPEGV
jgi:tetratricopeptide (TPR) repeat protein